MITPFLIMPAAASLIWKYSMFDTNIGMLNWAFAQVGLPQGVLEHRAPRWRRWSSC